MCVYSIHAPHRKAKAQERLMVGTIPGAPNISGLYDRGKSVEAKLVCIKDETKAVVKTMKFANSDFVRHQGIAHLIDTYEGKRNVKVTIKREGHYDMVWFPNGQRTYL